MNSIANNLNKIKLDIKRVAMSAKRNPNDIRLIAVSKTHPLAAVQLAHEAGQIDFGENYGQELVQKATHAHSDIRWHFIGHLQRNKINSLIEHIHCLHTLDRLSLAKALDERLKPLNKILSVLIEVKVSSDQNKTGASVNDLFDLILSLREFSNLKLEGLMMMASANVSDENKRLEMRQLKELQAEINQKALYPTPLKHLSMGMSHDYPIAIEEGATFLRIGSSIFGHRNTEEV